MLIRIPTVLVDTREKDPWEFKGREVRVMPAALAQGDYTLRGAQGAGGVIIERKSVEDLFLTMTRGAERFQRELERIKKVGYAFSCVVVEGSLERAALGSRYSWAQPERVVERCFSMCVRAGVAPYFMDGRQAAEDLAWRILQGFWQGKA